MILLNLFCIPFFILYLNFLSLGKSELFFMFLIVDWSWWTIFLIFLWVVIFRSECAFILHEFLEKFGVFNSVEIYLTEIVKLGLLGHGLSKIFNFCTVITNLSLNLYLFNFYFILIINKSYQSILICSNS